MFDVRWLVALVLAVSLALAGCSGDDGPPGGSDAGAADGGTTDDGSAPDDAGGGMDAGGGDDAGPGGDDGGLGDDGSPGDAGGDTDAGPPGMDAGAPDAGRPDAGRPDAGRPPPDSGPGTDAGPGGCVRNADCLPAEYCATALGDCSGAGRCTLRPGACPLIFDPHCGCDGTTYSNSCLAASVGENVAHSGACSPTCGLTPRMFPGCCFADSTCTGAGRPMHCVGESCTAGGEGTCVTDLLPAGSCWEDSDCTGGRTCMGANRCPCSFSCLVPDSPGTCVP